jgi:hypothetical protein
MGGMEPFVSCGAGVAPAGKLGLRKRSHDIGDLILRPHIGISHHDIDRSRMRRYARPDVLGKADSDSKGKAGASLLDLWPQYPLYRGVYLDIRSATSALPRYHLPLEKFSQGPHVNLPNSHSQGYQSEKVIEKCLVDYTA